jgi:phage protein D
MPISDPKNPLVPNFNILINCSLLSVEPETHVTNIVVDDDTELPSMFSFELVNSEWDTKDLQWIDEQQELFVIGNAVDIKLGYGDNLETIISGEITTLEPEFNFNRLPRLTVRGYDRRHRLQRGRNTRTFVQQKDSDIAEIIARDAGLTPKTADSKVIHPYILQANQTDWDFLQERARRIQYEVVV